ncbi:hypothetical protein [Paracraurococcus lichenis]|uniref:Uncharacterized protein n=1 Tax=Paracraurococcus lichenis TaxID=3064888 RepID=A0ABT9DYK4_9PROT|nr:hypothetical protein [Paracraurococcus sp. LOR1-02]MDO9708966.1 hypothetical protein [Paracraurococcus sp. LOR1-02]
MRRLAMLLPLLATPAFAQVQAVVAGAPDPSFRLVNRDPAAVHEIYVSPTGRRDWGMDRLGQDVLVPGRAARISLPAGQCVNDIRVVFADGRAVERRRVDTCAVSQMAFP